MKLNETFVPYKDIVVYDSVLPHYFCQKLIEKFEANERNVQEQTIYKNVRHFKEVNISQHWTDEHKIMENVMNGAWKNYMTACRVRYEIEWPSQFGFEAFRMKRYLPNGEDFFGPHTDVGSYASARRFLAFLWYLNDVSDGGVTGFGKDVEKPDLTVPAVEGRLLMFPPLWTFPHWGAKPISGPKYIISGYLHYI